MPDPASILLFERKQPRLDRAALRDFARRLSAEVGGGREFTCVLASDRKLRQLNRDFLGQDHATDVLSFPTGADTGPLGDMAISVDRAAEQAGGFGHTLEDEIRILMLHGVLHLAGYDHARDGGRMRRLETRWRRAFGLPAGLIERVRQ